MSCPYTHGCDHPLEGGQTTLKQNGLSQKPSPINSSLVRYEVGLMNPSILYARILTSMMLCGPCANKHSCYKFLSPTVLVCPEDTVPFWSSPTSGSHNFFILASTMVPESMWKQMIWMFHLWLAFQRHLFSEH